MRQIVQTFWWWIRVALIVVVSLYALLALWNNAGQPISVWYWFGRTENTSIAALAIAAFLLGGLVCSTFFALASATIRYRKTREQRRQRLIDEHREELARKAAMLRTKPPPAPIVKHKELPPTNAPIFVDLKEPKPTPAPMPVMTPKPQPIVSVPASPPSPSPTSVLSQAERTELSAPAPAGEVPISVEATRATPFASTPSIAPGAKVPEPLPIVEEDKGRPVPSPGTPGEG